MRVPYRGHVPCKYFSLITCNPATRTLRVSLLGSFSVQTTARSEADWAYNSLSACTFQGSRTGLFSLASHNLLSVAHSTSSHMSQIHSKLPYYGKRQIIIYNCQKSKKIWQNKSWSHESWSQSMSGTPS
jgi:hypothetical protein